MFGGSSSRRFTSSSKVSNIIIVIGGLFVVEALEISGVNSTSDITSN